MAQIGRSGAAGRFLAILATGWFAVVVSPLIPAGALADSEGYAGRGLTLSLSGVVGIPLSLEDQIEVTEFRSGNETRFLGDIEVDPGLGLGAQIGYRLHPRVALEGRFEWISKWDVAFGDSERQFPTVQGDVAEVEVTTLTGGLRVYALTGRVQPFATLGLGQIWIESKSDTPNFPVGQPPPIGRPGLTLNISDRSYSALAARLGGGFEFYLTERAAVLLGAAWVRPIGGTAEDFDYVSTEAGFQYRF